MAIIVFLFANYSKIFSHIESSSGHHLELKFFFWKCEQEALLEVLCYVISLIY